MTIERLKELRHAIDMAIRAVEHNQIQVPYFTPHESEKGLRDAGAIPLIHHMVLNDFAITDLREMRQDFAEKFYKLQ